MGYGGLRENRVLNNIARVNGEGVQLETGPRHAEIVICDVGLESAKASTVLGSKEENKHAEAEFEFDDDGDDDALDVGR